MAILNVRERRVETTIAYIGPFGSGKATNLAQLGRHEGARGVEAERAASDELGETLALEWHAPPGLQFRDCGLSVKVLATRGAPTAERLRPLVRAADGVVLVLDAHPSARDANRASAELVREIIADEGRAKLPVLVQVNKVDLEEARAASEVLADAVAEPGLAWPHVEAVASSGDGVVETLERALRDVLSSLEGAAPDPDRETSRPPPSPARLDANPLLSALRQVLRDTVEEHVAQLERRFVERTLGAIEGRLVAEIGAAVEARVAVVNGVGPAVGAIGAELQALRDESRHALTELRGELGADRERLGVELAELRARLEVVEEATSAGLARSDELAEAIARAKDQLKVDVLRAIDGRSKSDRDLAAAALLPLRRAIDQIATELKSVDLRDGFAEIGRDLGALRGQVEPIGKIGNAVRELGESLSRESTARRSQLDPIVAATDKLLALDATVRRELGESLPARMARIEQVVAERAAEAQEARTRTDGTVAELRDQVTELLDELKKRAKKGWFG